MEWHGRERGRKSLFVPASVAGTSRRSLISGERASILAASRLPSQDCVGRGLQQQPVVRRPFALSTPFVRPPPHAIGRGPQQGLSPRTPLALRRRSSALLARHRTPLPTSTQAYPLPRHFGAVRWRCRHAIARDLREARRCPPSLGASAPFVRSPRTPSHAGSNKHAGVRVSPARSYARLGSASRILQVAHGRNFPSQSHLICEVMLERLIQLFRKPCPSCGKRALRTRNWLRATCVDELGRGYPDSWAYESCDSCGSRFKRYAAGRIEAASADEWRQHVSDEPGSADE